VLDRETGESLFPVEERPVPQGGLPEEHVWPTHPFPTAPPALVPQRLTEADLWDADPKRHAECLEAFRGLRNHGLFTQTGTQGSILFYKVDAVPCNCPPWGWLVAVDLQDGTIAWRVPIASFDGVDGLPNFGHPLATGGGLVFHGGTIEPALRVHDIDTGALIARFELPAGPHAGPITDRSSEDEPQVRVVATGGHMGVGAKMRDHVLAYALPRGAIHAAAETSKSSPK